MMAASSSLRVAVLAVVLVFVVAGTSFGISQYLISEAKVEGKDIAQKRTQEREHQEKATKHRDNLLDVLRKVEVQLASNPSDSMLVASAANICYDLGEFEKAERYYRMFLNNISPGNVAAMIDLSFVLYQQNKVDEALELMNVVLKQDPNNQIALINKGYMLIQSGKVKEAVEVMKVCASINPNSEHGKTAIAFLKESISQKN